ncbi:hypothetical protein PRIPAC_78505 [Pristionchus pacificus]|uniref:G protein-coupled receptor n=1 Tax=Pristionchus pacificus TaxID=54126 RepID=A0A2A6CJF9_PRIPA|nr:hypothetical protein PRIPAC_78505 [Pristionchus pacificus]|eukprot:PDM78246.1 G protein-coupled receptor [Pristionchus pacificus]
MASLHATVQPASFTSCSALEVFSQSFPNEKQLIAAASGCMSVPFTLMNINFLHRYLSVRRTYYVVLFSKPKFLVMYGVSISAADTGMGKSILRKMAPEGITVEEGWLVLRFWEYGRLHIRGVVTLLCGGLKSLSNNYKVYQFKILRALFDQSAIPFLLPCRHWPGHSTLSHYTPPRTRLIHARLTDWFMLISSFPALDALVILTLLKDYRQGAISMLCGRKREQMELSSWKTNQWIPSTFHRKVACVSPQFWAIAEDVSAPEVDRVGRANAYFEFRLAIAVIIISAAHHRYALLIGVVSKTLYFFTCKLHVLMALNRYIYIFHDIENKTNSSVFKGSIFLCFFMAFLQSVSAPLLDSHLFVVFSSETLRWQFATTEWTPFYEAYLEYYVVLTECSIIIVFDSASFVKLRHIHRMVISKNKSSSAREMRLLLQSFCQLIPLSSVMVLFFFVAPECKSAFLAFLTSTAAWHFGVSLDGVIIVIFQIKLHTNCLIKPTIFASYDIIMASLHATVQPMDAPVEFEIKVAVSSFHVLSHRSKRRESVRNEETATRILNSKLQASFTSGSALGVFSQSFPNDKQIIAVASGCMSVPFTLMNINFLHRYLSVRRYGVSISVADNETGKSILRQMAPEEIIVEEGWLVLHFWEYGRLHIRGLVTLLCGGLLILVNLSIGATLCALTIYHLQTVKTFSDNYKVYQFKILRALFAQSAIPFLCMYCPVGVGLAIPLFRSTHHQGLDHWFMCISCFPALDAIVIISLLNDYREGAISMLCRRKREQMEISSWKTNESG